MVENKIYLQRILKLLQMEIRKFKGFALDLNIWVYGYYTYKKSVDQHYIEWHDKNCLGRKAAVYAESVSQFTGISDRFQNEIYENDKILICRSDVYYTGTIKYSNESSCYNVIEKSGFIHPFQRFSPMLRDFGFKESSFKLSPKWVAS
jgi:hypothetical protein